MSVIILVVNVVIVIFFKLRSRVFRSLRVFSTLTLINLWFVLLGLSENLGLAGDKDDGEFIGESFPGTGDFHVVFDLNRCRRVLDRSPVSEVSLIALSKLAIQHAGCRQQTNVAAMKGRGRSGSLGSLETD